MAQVGRVCIDRWEAHLLTRGEGGAERVHPHFQPPPEGQVFRAHSAPDVFPQAYISRVEASRACQASGKRLCSRGEWMRVCQGNPPRLYPYGPKYKAGTCNSGKPHLLGQRFGDSPARWTYANFNDPSLAREPGFLAKTGAYPDCASREGVFDLVGNLHEWVQDSVDQRLVDELEAESFKRHKQGWHTGNGIFVGGFFSNTFELGPGCAYITIAHEPRYHDYSTGFRCCAAPDDRGSTQSP